MVNIPIVGYGRMNKDIERVAILRMGLMLKLQTMIAQKGLCEEDYRLPMCEMESFNKEKVLKVMSRESI